MHRRTRTSDRPERQRTFEQKYATQNIRRGRAAVCKALNVVVARTSQCLLNQTHTHTHEIWWHTRMCKMRRRTKATRLRRMKGMQCSTDTLLDRCYHKIAHVVVVAKMNYIKVRMLIRLNVLLQWSAPYIHIIYNCRKHYLNKHRLLGKRLVRMRRNCRFFPCFVCALLYVCVWWGWFCTVFCVHIFVCLLQLYNTKYIRIYILIWDEGTRRRRLSVFVLRLAYVRCLRKIVHTRTDAICCPFTVF